MNDEAIFANFILLLLHMIDEILCGLPGVAHYLFLKLRIVYMDYRCIDVFYDWRFSFPGK